MPKLKKSPIFKYGIEITKPFSKAMYAHNDGVANEMRANIIEKWEKSIEELGAINMETPWNLFAKYTDLVQLQEGICSTGFGDGYTLGTVDKEFRNELETMANWQLHENYSYLCFEGLVERTTLMMVGFDWEKCDYAKDDVWRIGKIKEISKGGLRWSSCSDQDGNHWKEPYIKCDNEGHGNSFVLKLAAEGIESDVDVYEDEDGDDGWGKTIIRKIWSVKIKNIKK